MKENQDHKELYDQALRLYKQKKSTEIIKQSLLEKGAIPEDIEIVLSLLQKRKTALFEIGIGITLLVAGSTLMIIKYTSGLSNWSYLIAVTILISGTSIFMKGLADTPFQK